MALLCSQSSGRPFSGCSRWPSRTNTGFLNRNPPFQKRYPHLGNAYEACELRIWALLSVCSKTGTKLHFHERNVPIETSMKLGKNGTNLYRVTMRYTISYNYCKGDSNCTIVSRIKDVERVRRCAGASTAGRLLRGVVRVRRIASAEVGAHWWRKGLTNANKSPIPLPTEYLPHRTLQIFIGIYI